MDDTSRPQPARPLKIVYAGIKGSGKSANLRAIIDNLEDPSIREFAHVSDYSLDNSTMDFLLLEITPRFSPAIKVLILTVSPTIHREMSRDILLSGVDGVVVVIDSKADLFRINLKVLQEVVTSLSIADSRQKTKTPVIIQYNKRDLTDRLPLRYLQSQVNQAELPWITACSSQGKGALSTFRKILAIAMESRDSRIRSSIGYYR
jgi:signal recognition particle receptor subunit beta